ncbi:ABC transporter ATP-binding protein [Cellulomonas sp. S1-8]|uniref:ABC transporter ATP-binding protein n=1 Tax=Cellulomonas sp. S1-8 TaxID=2904790 RepID=UPI0022438E3D|nr:ATP-binding cassette domain-containing protein [Cellulomonas sp. S1-8]UZN05242.1 ATP-binding cassette domain-containing protein [Cellulomonas sp. S1-8]
MRLVVRSLRHAYPGAGSPVLDGVDVDLPAGTAAAVVGPSGSGKTTFMALLGGLLPVQDGHVAAVDQDGREHRVADVASWVLQTVSLLPARTALDNVLVGAWATTADMVVARQRAEAALADVGLAARAKDPARVLSGGESQRVAIARAMASQRPVILADEPTGQLDAATSAIVLDGMLAARGERTVVMVTHDAEVAARCDLVLELRDGRLRERS